MNQATGELNKKIGDFVKSKRQKLGMTTRDLAEKVYGDRKKCSHISNIENGTRGGFTTTTLGFIMEALNSTITFEEF